MTTGAVYAITCLANGYAYVGSSREPGKRWMRHRRALQAGRHHCRYLQNAWVKYGGDCFEMTLLQSEVPIAILLTAECRWMDRYPRRFNSMGPTASLTQGKRFTHSAETVATLRKLAAGRVMSPEACARNAAARIGKPRSAETRARIVATLKGKGKIALASTRAKMSMVRIGVKKSAETRARMKLAQAVRVLSAEARASMIAKNRAKTVSADVRARIGATQRLRRQKERDAIRATT
jgi:group I intron endonuclease